MGEFERIGSILKRGRLNPEPLNTSKRTVTSEVREALGDFLDRAGIPREAVLEPLPPSRHVRAVAVDGSRRWKWGDATLPPDPSACPTCRGTGYVEREIDGTWGTVEECADCAGSLTQKQRRLRRGSGLPEPPIGLDSWTFDAYETSLEGQRVAKAATEAWANQDAGALPWLVLYGPAGGGKTHLAAAAIESLISRGVHARFCYVPELVDLLRAHQVDGAYEDITQQLRDVTALALDDLGAVPHTEWASGEVLKVVDWRYRSHQPLLVTTNKSPEELEARTADRLQDYRISRVVPMIWPSARRR